jgi:hypothetical protein
MRVDATPEIDIGNRNLKYQNQKVLRLDKPTYALATLLLLYNRIVRVRTRGIHPQCQIIGSEISKPSSLTQLKISNPLGLECTCREAVNTH